MDLFPRSLSLDSEILPQSIVQIILYKTNISLLLNLLGIEINNLKNKYNIELQNWESIC